MWDIPGIGTREIGFGICSESGLVIQSPSPTPDEINSYYAETATYINPGRSGKPSGNKVDDVTRLLNITEDTLGRIPEKIFQVGCSDGYTLSRFRDSGKKVSVCGIDPSAASHELAKQLYNLDTLVGTFETYQPGPSKYELIILTHVLEHLFNPVFTLKACSDMQNDGDWILVEVPLFDRIDCFPPGMLSLEHINYFSEGTLIETTTKAGYEPVFIGKYYTINEYPVITIYAKKNPSYKTIESNDYESVNTLLVDYIIQEKLSWKKIEDKIFQRVKKGSSVYIYGAGIHTSQLLAYTDLKNYASIKGLLDSSPTKWGKMTGNYRCFNLEEIELGKDDIIIISSYASEDEIYDYLGERYRGDIVKLYGDDS
jgi:hypothetical protein